MSEDRVKKQVSIARSWTYLELLESIKCSAFDVFTTHDWFIDSSDVRLDRKQRLDERNESVPARNVKFKHADNSRQAL